MSQEIDDYTYRVIWSDEDQKYVGLCVEFPGLSWLDSDPGSTLIGIRSVVSNTLTDLKNNNEKIPAPLPNWKELE